MPDSDSSLVLGIETSCDETAAAVVRGRAMVMSNVIASQHDLHGEYGGVVPEIASRAHAERILPVIRRAIQDAGVSAKDLSGVAVGNRPGLIGSLLVGVAAAKAYAWSLGIPVIGVDHVQAHLYAGSLVRADEAGAGSSAESDSPTFPAIGLVVSGGHTSLYRCESATRLTRIGSTLDDAVGEAYDKVGAILGLAMPGGPRLDVLAQNGVEAAKSIRPGFPIARIAPDSLDFSFSGLKTAALYAFRGVPEDERRRAKREAKGIAPHTTYNAPLVAALFQEAAIQTLVLKVERALDRHRDCLTLLVGGGVSANSLLRTRMTDLSRERGLVLSLPAMEFCLDNAAMIAGLGSALMTERAGTGDELTMTAMPSADC